METATKSQLTAKTSRYYYNKVDSTTNRAEIDEQLNKKWYDDCNSKPQADNKLNTMQSMNDGWY